MIDWIVKLYRRMNRTARNVAVLLLAIIIALSTMHILTFPATAITRQVGESDPGIVIGDGTDTEGFDNASEGEITDVNPVDTEVSPAEEETAVILEETPASEEPAVITEPEQETNDASDDTEAVAAAAQEPTPEQSETPEVTPTPEPTLEPSETPEVTPTPEPTSEPSETPEVTPTPEPTLEPSKTPEATSTPEPTETPAAEEEPEEESDPEADIETSEDWNEMFRDVKLTGVWADDLLTLAELQKGYKESTKNFVKDDEGKKYGYTRYGAWYGDSYAEWDSLFVMFNLSYAGITTDVFPYQAGCEAWIDALKNAQMFHEGNTYVPNKGDLVFADVDEDGHADHVAIIKAVERDGAGNPDKLIVIEGNTDNEVKESTYEFYNPLIVGFAQLPENPEMVNATDAESPEESVTEEETPEIEPVLQFTGRANNVEVTVDFEEGAFPEGTTMRVKPVWNQSVLGAITDTVTDKEIIKVQAVDIIFLDEAGNEIEPAKPIKVMMKSVAAPVEVTEKPVVVHVDDQLSTSVVTTEEVENEAPQEAVAFEADAFSVYAIVYTVDFEYEKEGRLYRFSLDGGKSISLTELCEVLSLNEEHEDAYGFAARVTDVSFSNPALVRVAKESSGWMLYSLKAFNTEETLTITMNDGEIIIVQVTDDQEDGIWDLADQSITQFLHVSADSSVTQTEQERNAAFKLQFTYSLNEDVVHAIDNYDDTPVLVYDLSSVIADSPLEIKNYTNGVISIGTRKLGTYKVVDGKVRLTFTDTSYFDGRSSFSGFFNLTAETDETKLGSKDEWTYEFPGTGDTVTIHYKKTVEEGSKSGYSVKNADGSYTLKYTAKINVNSNLDSMTFIDVLGGLQTLDPSSVRINGRTVNVTSSSNGFTFDVASALGTTGIKSGEYQVTYETIVTEQQLQGMSSNKTTEINTASWKVNGDKDVPGGHTEIEIERPHEPVPVTKTISSTANQPGDTVTYTVTYGNETTPLSEFHFSDRMTDVVIPQGTVSVTYNGQTSQIDFSDSSKDTYYNKGTTTLYDYTIPHGTEGYGPVTVTYSVQLIDAETAKNSGIYDTTDVVNTAQEHKYYTTDTKKTTVTYEKEPHYAVTKTESSTKNDDGKWEPGTEISYTLTIGDANTEMSGVQIRDVMTDLQTLQGDVMIKVGNGQQMKLSDYVSGAIKWRDDGQYSTNDVELFNFSMPSNAGKGPVVITYTTKVIDQTAATSANVFGDKRIRNTGSGGKQSDTTEGIGGFDKIDVKKTVTQNGADVNGQTVEMGSTVHYTLTYGNPGMNLAGVVIEDWMTDLQKLTSDITITKADGTSFTMPSGSNQWSEGGNNWAFWDDGKYSTGSILLFKYRLPNDIGNGPIIIAYDVDIITEEEAKEAGVAGTQTAFNKFIEPQTEVKIEFPKEVTHNPQVRKEFDHWDIENSKVYWNIIVEKDADSAYPLENVTVRESWDRNQVSITEGNQSYYGYNNFDGTYFDSVHATVTTDDGTVLTPGVDYTIDKENTMFTFPVLNERVHINLAFNSPAKIIDGFTMHNQVRLNNDKEASAEETYNKPEVEAIKNGNYNESDRIITWEVQINPKGKEFYISDENKYVLLFEDILPAGLTILNYDSNSEENPSAHIAFGWRNYNAPLTAETQQDGTVKLSGNIHPKYNVWDGQQYNSEVSLSGNKVVVTYKTKLSDEEWNRITSSLSGSETFENHVEITAGDNEKFDATDSVTVTSSGYINKTDETREDGSGVVIDADKNNSKEISYKVEINPYGNVLNSSNTLTLTDYISTNMDLHTETVKVFSATMGSDGKLVPGEEINSALQISYNDDSRLLAIRGIPDATPYVLTYSCYARAQGEDTFTNTATLIGGGSHSSTVTDKHNIQTNDAGVKIDGIEMNLFKIDENNISKKLKNATFQLYECELEIGNLTNPERYSQNYWDDLLAMMDRITAGNGTAEEIAQIKEQFRITNYKAVGEPAVTGESGYTQWDGLNEHKLYAWKEVEAPENYTGNFDYHYFVGYQHINVNTDAIPQPLLSAEEQLNRKHAAWALDDACQLANNIRVASMANLTTWTATNVEAEYTSISATKVWENDWDDFYETRPSKGIILHLHRIDADGSEEEVGSPVPINVDDQGNWPTYTWNKLLAKDAEGNVLKYYVTEEPVEDYSTSYSDNGEGIASGEIVVTNRLIPKSTNIHVKKVFGEGITDKPESIKVTLYVIKTDRQGVVHTPEETSYEVELNDFNEWKWTFEKLPTKDTDGNALSYTAVEDVRTLEGNGYRFVVTYSDDGKGVYETTDVNPLTITNSKEPEIDIDIKKVDENNTPLSGAKFELYKKNKTGSYVIVENTEYEWLDKDNQFTVRIDGFTMRGLKDGDYQVREVSAPEGYIIVNRTPVTFSVVDGKIDEESNGLATGVTYAKAQGDMNASYSVTNEQGVQLPKTGGSGTGMITILGSILILLGAGVLLLRRRSESL